MKQSVPPAWPSVTCSKHPHCTQVISCWVSANVFESKTKKQKGRVRRDSARGLHGHRDRDLRKARCWNIPPLAMWQACNQYRCITQDDPWRTARSSERNLTVMRGDISSDVAPIWNYKFLIALASEGSRWHFVFHAALASSFTMRNYTTLHWMERDGLHSCYALAALDREV